MRPHEYDVRVLYDVGCGLHVDVPFTSERRSSRRVRGGCEKIRLTEFFVTSGYFVEGRHSSLLMSSSGLRVLFCSTIISGNTGCLLLCDSFSFL